MLWPISIMSSKGHSHQAIKLVLGFLLTVAVLVHVTIGEASAQIENPDDVSPFINRISAVGMELSEKNDLYTSVMLAQAILASDYGRSELSQAGVNNLFSMKGRYAGAYLGLTDKSEDCVEYRKYPSYKESLEDYVTLIKKGVNSKPNFYSGAWKSTTVNYKEATAFLTSRYAEDPIYDERLNRVIELYNLTDFDTAKSDEGTAAKLVDKNVFLEKINLRKHHTVSENETLIDIAKTYSIDLPYLIKVNELSHSAILVGQTLIVD